MRLPRPSAHSDLMDDHEGYKRLRIYQQAHDLAIQVHSLSLALPPFEGREEGPQVRRSAKRVSASIIEGWAQRKHKAEFLRYLDRSLGSSDETIEHLELILKTGSGFGRRELPGLVESYRSLSRQIAAFIRGVQRHHQIPRFYAPPPDPPPET